jgi:hypothetical protein
MYVVKLFVILCGVVFSRDLKTTPCPALVPGEIIESGSTSKWRYCIGYEISSTGDGGLLQIVDIDFPDNTLHRDRYAVSTTCSLSKINLYDKGERTEYMVDTLDETSWVKKVYRKTCK